MNNHNILKDESDNFFFKWGNNKPMTDSEKYVKKKGKLYLETILIISFSISLLSLSFLNINSILVNLAFILSLIIFLISALFAVTALSIKERNKTISKIHILELINQSSEYENLKNQIIEIYEKQDNIITYEQKLIILKLIDEYKEEKASEVLKNKIADRTN